MPEGNKSRVSGVGVELNYTENAGWLCCWRRSFTRVTGSSTTLRYLPRHRSPLLGQLPHRLAGGLSCHPAANPFAYLALFDGVIVPHQLGEGIQAKLLLKNTKFRRLG